MVSTTCSSNTERGGEGHSSADNQPQIRTFPRRARRPPGQTAASLSNREQHSRFDSGNGSVRAAESTPHASPATCGRSHKKKSCTSINTVSAYGTETNQFRRFDIQFWFFVTRGITKNEKTGAESVRARVSCGGFMCPPRVSNNLAADPRQPADKQTNRRQSVSAGGTKNIEV